MTPEPIIDSHVHFLDPTAVPLRWLAQAPTLAGPFLPRALIRQADGIAIEGVIAVEADAATGRHLDEARFLDNLDDEPTPILGIVAHAPLEKGRAVKGDLSALARLSRIKGIRRLFQDESNRDFFLESTFLEGLAMVRAQGWHFEICIRHDQIMAAVDLAERMPDLSFVLDHIGKPDIVNQRFDEWAKGLTRLSRSPNVVCKISGVVTEADHTAWTSAQVRPYLRHALESFGPTRCMFGSDWPILNLAADYRRWFDLVAGSTSDWTQDECCMFYRGNARRVYRLE